MRCRAGDDGNVRTLPPDLRHRRWISHSHQHHPGWQPRARHFIPEIIEQHDTCCETETDPREAAVPFDHLPPSKSTRRTSMSPPARAVASHRQPAGPASPPAPSFSLVVITPPPYDPKVPHHNPDDEAAMYRLSVEYWPTATAVH